MAWLEGDEVIGVGFGLRKCSPDVRVVAGQRVRFADLVRSQVSPDVVRVVFARRTEGEDLFLLNQGCVY